MFSACMSMTLSPTQAAAKIINIYPIPLLSVEGNPTAQKLTAKLAAAFARVSGYDTRVVDNTVPKATYGTYVVEGALNARASSEKQSYPAPAPDSSPSASTDQVIISGSIKNIYALNAKQPGAPESTPASYDVTTQLAPASSKNQYILYIYVKALNEAGKTQSVRAGQLVKGSIDDISTNLESIDVRPLLQLPTALRYSRVLLIPLLASNSDPLTNVLNSRLAEKFSSAGIMAIPSDGPYMTNQSDSLKRCNDTGSDGIMTFIASNNGPNPTAFGFARNTAELGVQYFSCLGEPLWSYNGIGRRTFLQSPSTGLSLLVSLWGALNKNTFQLKTNIGDAVGLFSSTQSRGAQYSIDFAANDQSFQNIAINQAVDQVVSNYCERFVLPKTGVTVANKDDPCKDAALALSATPAPTAIPTLEPLAVKKTTPESMDLQTWIARQAPNSRNLIQAMPARGSVAVRGGTFVEFPSTADLAWYDESNKLAAYRRTLSDGMELVITRDSMEAKPIPMPKAADLQFGRLNNGVGIGMPQKLALAQYGNATVNLAGDDGSGYSSATIPIKASKPYCAENATIIFEAASKNKVSAIALRYFKCR